MAYVVDSLGVARNFNANDVLENTNSGATPAYQLIRGNVWSADAPVAVGDYLVPTDFDDFEFLYQVTAVSGADAVTGSSEPSWPTAIDGTVADNGNTITCVSRRQVEFYENGFVSRDPADGPAIIMEDGTEIYMVNGRLTRSDGPAVNSPGGQNDKFFLQGRDVTEQVGEVSGLLSTSEFSIVITSDPTEGTVATDPTPGPFAFGTEVELTATAEAGFNFVRFTGDIETTDNPATVTVTKDLEVTAVYEAS